MPTRSQALTELTDEVLARFGEAPDPRVREVLQALVRHLHAFATEVALTDDEWARGIDFVTRAGQLSDERRQELILLSDVLGLSMLTVALNHGAGSQATEPTVFGPFFVEGSPEYANGDDLAHGFSGEPCLVSGRVTDGSGAPVAGARMEVWQADDQGFYDVQYADLDEPRGRGHLFTRDDGSYAFWTVKPVAYPIPGDGPVGELMRAARRSIMRPAHIHFMISAPGRRTLITHVFDREDPHLATDAVFGVKASLIGDFLRHEAGRAPDGRSLASPFHTLSYDFVLAPEREEAA